MILNIIKSQLKNELKFFTRDSFLRYMVFLPIVTGMMLKIIFPRLSNILSVSFDLDSYYLLLVSFVFGLVMPSVLGMLTGFLILDEKDEGTLIVLKVTPLQPSTYLKNKLIFPAILSIILNLVGIIISGIAINSLLTLIIILTMSAFWSPIFALLLSTFANNKVEGFAMAKLFGVIFLVPVIAYFFPLPWQLFFGLVPAYWPVMLIWSTSSSYLSYFLLLTYIIIGFLTNYALLIILFRNFQKKKLSN